MEEKVFELLEKLYNEVTGLKSEVTGLKGEVTGLKGEVTGLKGEFTDFRTEVNGRFDRLEGKMGKLELNQEAMNDKLDEAFEAISSHAEINERQHQEILMELKGEISVVELAVKRVAK